MLFFSRLYFRRGEDFEEYSVESVRLHKGYFVVTLGGIRNISQAQELVGRDVFLPEKDLQPLQEDSYYLHRLIGARVETPEGVKIGVVRDAMTAPGHDLLVVDNQGRDVLIPFTDAICIEVDPEAGRIVIDPPAGLLELNEI